MLLFLLPAALALTPLGPDPTRTRLVGPSSRRGTRGDGVQHPVHGLKVGKRGCGRFDTSALVAKIRFNDSSYEEFISAQCSRPCEQCPDCKDWIADDMERMMLGPVLDLGRCTWILPGVDFCTGARAEDLWVGRSTGARRRSWWINWGGLLQDQSRSGSGCRENCRIAGGR
eukprot:Hpha_TRINITY_DN6824_c0_g1::TRINITY_DN6824_c0_g1_i1::g.46188::m.46188